MQKCHKRINDDRRRFRVCNLLAREFRPDGYRGSLEREYHVIFSVLHSVVADPMRRYSYVLEINDMLVSDDLAVARVVWTLTLTPRDAPVDERLAGVLLGLILQTAGGTSKIVQFSAYEAP